MKFKDSNVSNIFKDFKSSDFRYDPDILTARVEDLREVVQINYGIQRQPSQSTAMYEINKAIEKYKNLCIVVHLVYDPKIGKLRVSDGGHRIEYLPAGTKVLCIIHTLSSEFEFNELTALCNTSKKFPSSRIQAGIRDIGPKLSVLLEDIRELGVAIDKYRDSIGSSKSEESFTTIAKEVSSFIMGSPVCSASKARKILLKNSNYIDEIIEEFFVYYKKLYKAAVSGKILCRRKRHTFNPKIRIAAFAVMEKDNTRKCNKVIKVVKNAMSCKEKYDDFVASIDRPDQRGSASEVRYIYDHISSEIERG